MPNYLSTLNWNGEDLTVKDTEARNAAATAYSKAEDAETAAGTASSVATTAYNLAQTKLPISGPVSSSIDVTAGGLNPSIDFTANNIDLQAGSTALLRVNNLTNSSFTSAQNLDLQAGPDDNLADLNLKANRIFYNGQQVIFGQPGEVTVYSKTLSAAGWSTFYGPRQYQMMVNLSPYPDGIGYIIPHCTDFDELTNQDNFYKANILAVPQRTSPPYGFLLYADNKPSSDIQVDFVFIKAGYHQFYNPCYDPNKMLTLWVNPHPENSFAGSEVSISFYDITRIKIDLGFMSGDDPMVQCSLDLPIVSLDYSTASTNTVSSIDTSIMTRSITKTVNGLQFGDCETILIAHDLSPSVYQQDNDNLIPLAVYGFR